MYKAITFDFDDTLTDRGELYRRYSYYIIDKYFSLPEGADKEEIVNQLCEWDCRGYSDRIAVNNRIIERWKLSVTAEQLQDELFDEGAKFTVRLFFKVIKSPPPGLRSTSTISSFQETSGCISQAKRFS